PYNNNNKNNKLLAAIITIITLLLLGFLITNSNSEPDIIMTKDGHIKKINNNKIKCEEERLLGLVSTGKINCYIRRD
ncbi:MAG: hypothetical protein QXD25_01800, partial [Nanopusillaceae archaeon]